MYEPIRRGPSSPALLVMLDMSHGAIVFELSKLRSSDVNGEDE